MLHMAALKSVGESVAKPLEYYQNNIVGTLNLLKAMPASGCKRVVFSSSATVYGNPEKVCRQAQAPVAPEQSATIFGHIATSPDVPPLTAPSPGAARREFQAGMLEPIRPDQAVCGGASATP